METNKRVPIVITRGVVVFPKSELLLDVGRVASKNAVDTSIADFNSQVLVVSQKDPSNDEVSINDLFMVGTLTRIKSKQVRSDQAYKVLFQGQTRVQVTHVEVEDGTYYAVVDELETVNGDATQEMVLVRKLAKSLEDLTPQLPGMPKDLLANLSNGLTASELSDTISAYFPAPFVVKQELLEMVSVNERIERLLVEIEKEKSAAQFEDLINSKVRQKIDENQKEYYLREKMRAIKEELGDVAPKDEDMDDLRVLVENNPYPEHVKAKALEEIKRYEMMPGASSESSVIRTYLDWLLKTPWYQQTEDQKDLSVVEATLEADHFGLEKIKERILEYLAVKQMTQSLKAPILCLVGPPGVGKTSLAKSVSRALDRQFVKISLGGVKDESEIRGHRRTYLGSMPGRIIQGMKKAGVINPVFLLDEIDKMASDYKGDPASAMLEVLDPEQNKMFSDHYIEENYDLSNVLFIATANYLENVPAALRDRLEIIEVSSYTEQEKMEIAKRHLIPKQLLQHGLTPEQFKLYDAEILSIIQYYTREAGVRQLERIIGRLCRKSVVLILKGEVDSVVISQETLVDFLGKHIFEHGLQEVKPEVGLVTGLAYTQYGGDILPIEVNRFKGKGKVTITGQLGDVMQESASIAFDYVRANAEKYQIDDEDFTKYDVHIHVPEGAVPKDGPSAGVTLATAIVSLFTNKAVRSDLGMTGEITLRGKVLPIGGLKEKSISAHRSGLKTIIIPKGNEKDIDDIPEQVRNELQIILADQIDQVFENAIIS